MNEIASYSVWVKTFGDRDEFLSYFETKRKCDAVKAKIGGNVYEIEKVSQDADADESNLECRSAEGGEWKVLASLVPEIDDEFIENAVAIEVGDSEVSDAFDYKGFGIPV